MKEFIRGGINGFCMALADSVPGVSGGTVAFIMGFYDQFIGSIHDVAFGGKEEKKRGIRYLIRLGIGWIIGMCLAVLILTSLFESHIHVVSSLFIGFIAGSIPLIYLEEKESFRQFAKGILFCLLGIALVVGISVLNGSAGGGSMDLSHFQLGLGIRLFFIGMIAISAMFLPGISGSTLLLIFGAYIPVMTAVRGFLSMNLSYAPLLIFFGCGVIAGALTVVKIIKLCLERHRVQSMYAILGMMLGSFYAIVQGPTTLDVPQAPLSLSNFSIPACIAGVALVLFLQYVKSRREKADAAQR